MATLITSPTHYSARNTTLLTPYFSLIDRIRCSLPGIKLATISDARNMEIGTPSNMSSGNYNTPNYLFIELFQQRISGDS
jgi:hypothetical protein